MRRVEIRIFQRTKWAVQIPGHVPFGFCNSPSICRREYVNTIFTDFIRENKVLVCINDFIACQKTAKLDSERLKEVLHTAESYGLEFSWKSADF